jgi:hypothetical protein
MIKGKQKTKQGNLKHNIFISHFIRAIFWNDQDWKSLKKNAQICLSVFTINYINKRTPFTRVVWPSRSLHEGLYGSSDGCCYVDRCHLTRVVWPSRILHEGLYGSSDGCCYVDRCYLTRVVRPSRVYMKDYMDLVMAVVMLTDTICLPTNHQLQLLIVFHVHSCRPSRTGNTHQCRKNIFMSKGCQ